MNIRSSASVIRNDLKYFGVGNTAYDVALRLLNRVCFFKRLEVLSLSEIRMADQLPDHFHFRTISLPELGEWARDPEYGIHPLLLEEVRHAQNTCFGVFDGAKLAQYLFFFTQPTMMSDRLQVTFNPGHAYLCATFTHPDYRGLHLNSIGVGLAAKEYQNRGYKVLLAYVESNNFSSLRSLYRIGWENIGSVDILRISSRYFIRASQGCRPFGFGVRELQNETGGSGTTVANRRAS